MPKPFLLAFELLCHSNEDVSHHKLVQVIVPELLCLSGTSQRFSKFVLLRMTSSSSFRRGSRYEERKEVVNDVGRGDARDICVIVGRCDFDDVCTADHEWKRKRTLVREECRY